MQKKLRAWQACVIATSMLCLPSAYAAARAVGSIPAAFNVSLSGSASYTIPIRLAPGTAGTQPRIEISYSSQAPGGSLGAGWNVLAGSAITRGPKNLRTDGMLAAVNLSDDDALYLDGQRLIPISSTGTGSGRRTEYRKEIDDLTKIIQTGSDFGTAKFEAYSKGGVKLEFNNVPGQPPNRNRGDIHFEDGTVFTRAQSRAIDSAGNYIDYYYQVNGKGGYEIGSVSYTGHVATATTPEQPPYSFVEFKYASTQRVLTFYIAGRAVVLDKQLSSIRNCVVGNQGCKQVSRYEFEYEDRSSANRFVLKTLHQFGEDDSELEPTKFSYAKPVFGWSDAAYSFPAVIAEHEQIASGYRFGHFSDDAKGLPDLLYSALINGNIESFAFQNKGNSWSRLDGFKAPFAFSSGDGADLGAALVDLNGDGRLDLLQSFRTGAGALTSSAFLAGKSGWDKNDAYALPFPISQDGKVIAKYAFARFTGGVGPDLIYQSAGTGGFLANKSGWQPDNRFAPPFDLSLGFFAVDIACEGKPSLVGRAMGMDGKLAWKTFRFGSTKWDEVTDSKFQVPIPADVEPEAVRALAIDASGCPGIIFASAQGGGQHAAFKATPTGWQSVGGKAPPFDLVSSSGTPYEANLIHYGSAGLDDILVSRKALDGSITKFLYAQTKTGWEDRTSDLASLPVLNGPGLAQRAILADFDGDGKTDVAIPEDSLRSFGHLFIANSTGYAEQPNFIPPTAFARQDKQDRGIRLVDLNGDGLPDILVSRAGGIQKAWINTGNGWREEPGLTPSVPFAGEGYVSNPVVFSDFNGDGYADLLYSYRSADGKVATRLFLNTDAGNGARKWVEVTAADPQYGIVPPATYPISSASSGDSGVRFADLSGSGRPYMLVGSMQAGATGSQTLLAFKYDGSTWVPSPEFNPPVPFVAIDTNYGPAGRDLGVQLIDVNGDGLPDIVANYHDPNDPSKVVTGVWINTGSGWSSDPGYSVPVALDGLLYDAQGGLRPDTNAIVQWIDINGDGLPDVIYTKRTGNQNQSATYISTGKGWVPSPEWQIPIDSIADRNGDPGIRITDINGDGFPDILYSRLESDGSTKKGLFINTGNGWSLEANASLPDIAFVDKDGNDLGVRLIDVDGRGLVGLVQAYQADVTQTRISLNSSRRSDIISSIDSGYGSQTRIFYQSLMEQSVPDLGGGTNANTRRWQRVFEPNSEPLQYPFITPVPATYVVRRVISDERGGSTPFSYRYGAFRMDVVTKRPLGFGWRDNLNELSSVLTHVVVDQSLEATGKTTRETSCLLVNGVAGALPVDACLNKTPISKWASVLSDTKIVGKSNARK